MLDSILKHLKAVAEKSKRSYAEGRYDLDADMIKAFDELGLPYHCDMKQIKKRYFELCKEFHPDTAEEEGMDNERFLRIKEAYDVLKDGFRERDDE